MVIEVCEIVYLVLSLHGLENSVGCDESGVCIMFIILNACFLYI